MRIAIGSDHRGFALKEGLKELLGELGHEWVDFGCQSEEPVDYPDVAQPLAEAVARGEFDGGILICGSGIGMSIAANKVKGVRAALCCKACSAELTRRHNDANILCLAAMNDLNENLSCVDVFLKTNFECGRHLRRVEKITAMEKAT